MDEGLKVCPFCGGDAQEPDNDARPGKTPRWSISCYQYCVSIHRGTRKETIAAWNTRSEPSTEAMRNALEAFMNLPHLFDDVCDRGAECKVCAVVELGRAALTARAAIKETP